MAKQHVRIALKRVYDEPDPGDGTRVLVERLWPRGLTLHKRVKGKQQPSFSRERDAVVSSALRTSEKQGAVKWRAERRGTWYSTSSRKRNR
jgi:uncharacterized protein YeaO (DUF488 family)